MKTPGGFNSLFYTLKSSLRVNPYKLFKTLTSKNACKTCALGMGGQNGGMTNEIGHFPEFCKKSIQAHLSDLKIQLKEEYFIKNSVSDLQKLSSYELEQLGRIPFPLVKFKNDKNFRKSTWEEFFLNMERKFKKLNPDKSFFYMSGRSSNEAGFLLQLFARDFGTNHINNCSYYCHQASSVALKESIGSGASTIDINDLNSTDLIFLIGANPTSNHPRLMSHLMNIKNKSGKVVVINPIVEPGLVKFKIPSNLKSLFFGTQIADHYLQINGGGDIALLSGIAKYLIEENLYNTNFVSSATNHFEGFKSEILKLEWKDIESSSGILKHEIIKVSKILAESKSAVFAWTMGITHHLHGTDNVRSIINLALLSGQIGKKGSGLLPIRGHSNVQGLGTIGVAPKLQEKVLLKLEQKGLKPPTNIGFDTMECIKKSNEGEIDFALCLGGNLYGSNPHSEFTKNAFSKIETVVYINTTLNTGHAYGLGNETWVLPAKARDEEHEKTTQESMFNFVRLSEGGKSRLPFALSEVDMVARLGESVLLNSLLPWKKFKSHSFIRSWISEIIEELEPLGEIDQNKKEFTIKKRIFHEPKFMTTNEKANFFSVKIPEQSKDTLKLMTIRSEGQFNTVVFETHDEFRRISHRKVILMNKNDINILKLSDNDLVTVVSKIGKMDNIQIKSFNIKKGFTAMYSPEANVLIPLDVDPYSKTPSFKMIDIHIHKTEGLYEKTNYKNI